MDKFKFNREFQIRILSLTFQDYAFLALANDILVPEYFDDRVLSWCFQCIRNYFLDFKKKPTKLVLERELEVGLARGTVKDKDKEVFNDTLNRIIEYATQYDDNDYVQKEVIRFAKRQAVRKAVLEVAPLTDSADEGVWDKIEVTVRDACSVGGTGLDVGTQYFEEISQRLADRAQYQTKLIIPTGIPDLDNLLGGGLKAGQLGVWAGGSSSGKSIALPHCGRRAIINGYKVVHYTLELDEKDIAERYDASFANIPIHELIPESRTLEKKLDSLKGKYGNSLIIKQYPTGSATVSTLRNHIIQLHGLGFVPDLVIVDYGDLLKPHTKYNDEYSDLGKIFEGLRGLAGEFSVPVWTATQLNRSGMSAELPDMEHVGDSIKKVQIADILIAICMTKEEREKNEARLHIAKNRNGPGKAVVPITTAYDKMKFYNPIAMLKQEEEPTAPKVFRRKPKEQGNNTEMF